MLDPVLNLLFKEEMVTEFNQPVIGLSIENLKNSVYYLVLEVIQARGREEALLVLILVVVSLNLLGNVFRYLAQVFAAIVRAGVTRNIREDLFSKMLKKQMNFFDNSRRGDLITRVTADVDEVERSVVTAIQAVFRDPFYLLFFLFILLQFSFELTLVIMVVMALTALIVSLIGKSLKREATEGQKVFSQLIGVLDETVGGMRIIKAFRAEGYTAKVFNRFNTGFARLFKRQLFRKSLASPLSEAMFIMAVGVILWYGGKLVFEGKFESSEFMVYILLVARIIQPAKALSSSFGAIYKGLASAERIFDLMDHPVKIRDMANAKAKPDFSSSIEVKNLHFRYEDEWVLKDLSLSIKKGGFYALVGPSGCGKSTLAELLLRYYEPQEGVVEIDGENINNIKVADLRALFAVVTQDPILFNDSIHNNIAFGQRNASREEVIKAARLANAHEFISKMENAYDTEIGDRGVLLSGGQRQRLSIARAILDNPPILLLDEATSALDTESERIVQQALNKLMKSRTSLVIAHRLSTIRDADEIFVMNQGEIVERGKHHELIGLNGIYKRLTEMQSLDN